MNDAAIIAARHLRGWPITAPDTRCPKCNAVKLAEQKMCSRCWHRRNDRKGENKR